jgi:Spy/CpxP family protein refolding chaperone
MNTKRFALTLALAAMILTPLTMAAPDDNRPGWGAGRAGMPGGDRPAFGRGGGIVQMLQGRMGEELNLTEDQRQSIRKISEESRTAVQENRQAVAEAMQALNDAADKGNEEAIKAAGKTAGEALTKQALQQAEVTKKVKAVLTDEQKTKLEELRKEMQERMEDMRQQRRQQDGTGAGQGAVRQGRGPRNDSTND